MLIRVGDLRRLIKEAVTLDSVLTNIVRSFTFGVLNRVGIQAGTSTTAEQVNDAIIEVPRKYASKLMRVATEKVDPNIAKRLHQFSPIDVKRACAKVLTMYNVTDNYTVDTLANMTYDAMQYM